MTGPLTVEGLYKILAKLPYSAKIAVWEFGAGDCVDANCVELHQDSSGLTRRVAITFESPPPKEVKIVTFRDGVEVRS